MKYANLHLHSNRSDGSLSPTQLVRIGKSFGYRALALTDHETDGGVPVFQACAEAEGGIDTVPGIEFYGMHEGVNLHLVALDYDMDNPILRALVQERCEKRYEATRGRVKLGIEKGYIEGVTWEDIERFAPKGSWICFAHVARAYDILSIPIPSDLNQNVFKSPEAQAFAVETPSAERVIKAVRAAGGIIGLAHPNDRTHFVPALVDMGLNGIEISHPKLREDTTELALEMSEKYNLYPCGGTDHTGVMSGLGGGHARPACQGLTEEEYFILKERRR